jgi:hypothetical protein
VGQAFSRLRLSACRSPGQVTAVALDQCRIHLLSRVSLMGEPLSELITSSQIVPDTVPRLSLLLEGGRQFVEVGSQQAVSQPCEDGRPRKVGLDHGLLLLLVSGLERRSIACLDPVEDRKQGRFLASGAERVWNRLGIVPSQAGAQWYHCRDL